MSDPPEASDKIPGVSLQLDGALRMIEVPVFSDQRGSLAVVEFAQLLPFVPARFYYIYGTSDGVERAGHAHWLDCEAILAIHGGFTVSLDDGHASVEHVLDRPDRLLVIPPFHWHKLHSFQPGSICAVFASRPHDCEDYCHDYDGFLRAVGH